MAGPGLGWSRSSRGAGAEGLSVEVLAVPHAWSNPYDEPVRWLRMRSPQPRLIGQNTGTYASDDVAIPTDRRTPDELDVTSRGRALLGGDMSPPGPLSMPGSHGHNIRDISIRMMVDDVLGAQHHTLFMAEFACRGGRGWRPRSTSTPSRRPISSCGSHDGDPWRAAVRPAGRRLHLGRDGDLERVLLRRRLEGP